MTPPLPDLPKPWITQLRRGILDLCLLASLRQGEAYGYEIMQRLEKTSFLSVTESTLYPILSRLANERLLAVRTAASPFGPQRRYYRLTPLGLSRLEEMSKDWSDLTAAVQNCLTPKTTQDHDHLTEPQPGRAA